MSFVYDRWELAHKKTFLTECENEAISILPFLVTYYSNWNVRASDNSLCSFLLYTKEICSLYVLIAS